MLATVGSVAHVCDFYLFLHFSLWIIYLYYLLIVLLFHSHEIREFHIQEMQSRILELTNSAVGARKTWH